MDVRSKKELRLLRRKFERQFGTARGRLRAAVAPGRANLIGEHTDYNGGLVLPVAVNRHTAVVFGRTVEKKGTEAGERILVRAERFGADGDDSFAADRPPCRLREPRKHWANYVRGVAAALLEAGVKLRGGKLYVTGDLPLGAGLSSSAALTGATALALCAGSGVKAPPRLELARLCQRAEHSFAGVRCGIMDQIAVLCARAGCALLLDCAAEEIKSVPLVLEGKAFAVFDTGVRHELAAGEYNKRRAECERAARRLGVKFVSEITVAALLRRGHLLSPAQHKRVRHVLSENLRTAQFAAALRSGDTASLGALLSASHAGLRDEYEVSCEELNVLQEMLTITVNRELGGRMPAVFGARMMGGGFGGAVIALVRAGAFPRLKALVGERYRKRFGGRAPALLLRPAGGATVVSL